MRVMRPCRNDEGVLNMVLSGAVVGSKTGTQSSLAGLAEWFSERQWRSGRQHCSNRELHDLVLGLGGLREV